MTDSRIDRAIETLAALAEQFAALRADVDSLMAKNVPGIAAGLTPGGDATEADQWGSLPEAAKRFNITKDAIRSRLRHHPAFGRKRGPWWDQVNITAMARQFGGNQQ